MRVAKRDSQVRRDRYENGNIGDKAIPALGGLPLDRKSCDTVKTPQTGEDLKDCTEQVQELVGRVPLIGRFLVSKSSGKCELLEVVTLRSIGADNERFLGIGLYYRGQAVRILRQDLFVSASYGREAANPVLIAEKFYLQGKCFGVGRNSATISRRTFETKAFAEYRAADRADKVYRNWENHEGNHTIRPSATPASIDRRPELISKEMCRVSGGSGAATEPAECRDSR